MKLFMQYNPQFQNHQSSQYPESSSTAHSMSQWNTIPESTDRSSEHNWPAQDVAMEPRLDLATATDPWDECGEPALHPDVEQHDEDYLLEEDKGRHFESSAKGSTGNCGENGDPMGGILEGSS